MLVTRYYEHSTTIGRLENCWFWFNGHIADFYRGGEIYYEMCLKQEYSRRHNSRKYLSESVSSLRQNVFFFRFHLIYRVFQEE